MVIENKQHPGAELRDRHLEYIMVNWELIAKACYKGFLEMGKGMFIVNEQDFMSKPRGVLAKIRMDYVPKDKLPKFKDGDKEQAWLNEYDPEKEMIVGFMRADLGFSSYRIEGRGDGRPKLLYEKSLEGGGGGQEKGGG